MFKKIFILVILSILTSSIFAATEDNNTSVAAISEQTIVASYDELPIKLHKDQVFAVKIKVLGKLKSGVVLTYVCTNDIGIKQLNQNTSFNIQDDGSFILTLLYKVVAQKVRTPDIMVNFTGGNEKDANILEGRTYDIEEVPESPFSTGVLAQSMKINNKKIDKYDSSNNIIVLDISAKLANIEDFKIKNVAQQGINNIKQGRYESSILYYLVIPATQDTIEFQYFNTSTDQLETVAVKLDLSNIEDKVSTQTDLSPKSPDKALYVFIVVTLIATTLYAIYYFKRERIFLILIIVVIGAGFLFLFVPNEQAKIKKDCVVYLLPTESSTPFFKADIDTPVEKIKEADGYIKIKLKNGKIGWVRAECVSKN